MLILSILLNVLLSRNLRFNHNYAEPLRSLESMVIIYEASESDDDDLHYRAINRVTGA